jgi:predicted Rossmann-fold nucleotide-binding protein
MQICVFGSSRASTPQPYKDAAFELGQLLAKKGHLCINGGGMNG